MINTVIYCNLFFDSENPREFLIEQLEQLKISGQSDVRGPNLFNNTDLDTVFSILDPANQKYITFAQYKHGKHRTWGYLEGRGTLNMIKSVSESFLLSLHSVQTF